MDQLHIFGESLQGAENLRRQLAGVLDVEINRLEHFNRRPPGAFMLFDCELNDAAYSAPLKQWLERKPKNARVVFVTDKESRLQNMRAFALGATDVVHRPLDVRALLAALWGDVASLSASRTNEQIGASAGAAAAVTTLQSIFSSACLGAPLDAPAMSAAGDLVVGQVEAQGLAAWIDIVRTHHSQTYQHCLLVTGLAAAFGQRIGASRADRQRLSIAGMLHDIGKARIPLAILEKPGPLDDGEMALMRKHPEYGLDALRSVPGLPAEMLDMVVHHHEYLDGSGYPHGLMAGEIADLVRIVTIADVFGALIERRSYRPPLSGDEAYRILLDMGPKLDKDLVRAFKFAATLGSLG
jgi:putative nucleotidyltransferase with HDIG domain